MSGLFGRETRYDRENREAKEREDHVQGRDKAEPAVRDPEKDPQPLNVMTPNQQEKWADKAMEGTTWRDSWDKAAEREAGS